MQARVPYGGCTSLTRRSGLLGPLSVQPRRAVQVCSTLLIGPAACPAYLQARRPDAICGVKVCCKGSSCCSDVNLSAIHAKKHLAVLQHVQRIQAEFTHAAQAVSWADLLSLTSFKHALPIAEAHAVVLWLYRPDSITDARLLCSTYAASGISSITSGHHCSAGGCCRRLERGASTQQWQLLLQHSLRLCSSLPQPGELL